MFDKLVHFWLSFAIIILLLSHLNINDVIGIFTSETQSLLTFISINLDVNTVLVKRRDYGRFLCNYEYGWLLNLKHPFSDPQLGLFQQITELVKVER